MPMVMVMMIMTEIHLSCLPYTVQQCYIDIDTAAFCRTYMYSYTSLTQMPKEQGTKERDYTTCGLSVTKKFDCNRECPYFEGVLDEKFDCSSACT